MPDIWNAEHIEIGISSLEDFERFPPHQFEVQADGRLKFDSNFVNVFSGWKWLFEDNPNPLEYIIPDHNALIATKRQLLSMPTVMSFDLIDKSRFPSKTKKFMIFINPKHATIKKKLEKLLNQCTSLLEEGQQQFALELRLDNAISNFCQKSEGFKNFKVPYDSKFICITNGGQRFQQLYRNPWCWVGLFPIALLCGVPYCLCRGCTTEDIICQLIANVTLVKHHDGHHSIDHFEKHHEDDVEENHKNHDQSQHHGHHHHHMHHIHQEHSHEHLHQHNHHIHLEHHHRREDHHYHHHEVHEQRVNDDVAM